MKTLYLITIHDIILNTKDYFEKNNENDLNNLINKELKGWGNLQTASTSGINDDSYCLSGITKDKQKTFSILKITFKN